METCACCGKKVDERTIQWVFGYSVCSECVSYYGEDEVVEKIESCEQGKDLVAPETDKFADLKNAIRPGKKVFWKNNSYRCHVSPSNELCITFIPSGNMQWASKSYNVSDFIVEA